MQITYDPEVDILMVHLGDVATRGTGCRRLPYGDAVADVAADGTILALEFLNASHRYPVERLRQKPREADAPMSLAEAARVLGTTLQAVRKAITRGRLEGKKIGRNWTVTGTALTAYANSRVHEGSPARKAARVDVA